MGLSKTAGLFSKLRYMFAVEQAAKGAKKSVSSGRGYLERHKVGGYGKLDAQEPASKLNLSGYLKAPKSS